VHTNLHIFGRPNYTVPPHALPVDMTQHVAGLPSYTSPPPPPHAHRLVGTIAHKDSDPRTASSCARTYCGGTGTATADRYDSSAGPKHAGPVEGGSTCWRELQLGQGLWRSSC